MDVQTAAQLIEAALREVEDVDVTADLGANLDPPAVILGPPDLAFEAMSSTPTVAAFPVWVVAGADEDAMPRLWALLPAVAAAVDDLDFAAVTVAIPGAYNSGGSDLPAYELTVEAAL